MIENEDFINVCVSKPKRQNFKDDVSYYNALGNFFDLSNALNKCDWDYEEIKTHIDVFGWVDTETKNNDIKNYFSDFLYSWDY